jgi:hypothetical protein
VGSGFEVGVGSGVDAGVGSGIEVGESLAEGDSHPPVPTKISRHPRMIAGNFLISLGTGHLFDETTAGHKVK